MKKFISGLVAAVMVCSASATLAFAEDPDIIVTTTTDAASYQAGDYVCVQVELKGHKFNGFGTTLKFDESLLEFDSCYETNDLPAVTPTYITDSGEVAVMFANAMDQEPIIKDKKTKKDREAVYTYEIWFLVKEGANAEYEFKTENRLSAKGNNQFSYGTGTLITPGFVNDAKVTFGNPGPQPVAPVVTPGADSAKYYNDGSANKTVAFQGSIVANDGFNALVFDFGNDKVDRWRLSQAFAGESTVVTYGYNLVDVPEVAEVNATVSADMLLD